MNFEPLRSVTGDPAPAGPPPPLAPRLRHACRSVHARLHHHPLLAPLLGTGVTRAAYGRVLRAYHAFYAWIEAALVDYETRATPAFRYSPRLKLPQLAADLAALGLACPPALEAPPPALASDAEYLGACYVLEGSTLGGRVIAAQLGPRLGLEPARGLSFFLCYGAEADARWSEFGAALERCAPEAERVTASALAVFAAIEAVLDAHGSTGRDG